MQVSWRKASLIVTGALLCLCAVVWGIDLLSGPGKTMFWETDEEGRRQLIMKIDEKGTVGYIDVEYNFAVIVCFGDDREVPEEDRKTPSMRAGKDSSEFWGGLLPRRVVVEHGKSQLVYILPDCEKLRFEINPGDARRLLYDDQGWARRYSDLFEESFFILRPDDQRLAKEAMKRARREEK